MRRFLLHWLVLAVALGVTHAIVPGVGVRSGPALVLAAFVLGFVNAVVRPILVVLTLPITLFTLGLFYLVVNGIAFAITAALVPGFTVAGIGSAIAGALVVSLISGLVGWALRPAAGRGDR